MKSQIIERAIGCRNRLNIEPLIKSARTESGRGELLRNRIIDSIGIRGGEGSRHAKPEFQRVLEPHPCWCAAK